MKYLFKKFNSFLDLSGVCLSMLFRPSIRSRLIFLIIGFVLMMTYNLYSHFNNVKKLRNDQIEILTEDAYKVFFISSLEIADYNDLVDKLEKKDLFNKYKSSIIKGAFIHKKNLFIDILTPDKKNDSDDSPIKILYRLFGMSKFADSFYDTNNTDDFEINIKKDYFDHNGIKINKSEQKIRLDKCQEDIRFFLASIRINSSNKKRIYDAQERKILDLSPVHNTKEINPFFSEVEIVIPINIINFLINIKELNKNQIRDALIETDDNNLLKVQKEYLEPPEDLSKMDNLMPRYIPLFCKEFIYKKNKNINRFFIPQLEYQNELMKFLKELQYLGNYLFSFEKLSIIEYKINKLNSDIYKAQINFFIVDIIIGIVFPFMISFFAFIYLKKEMAFMQFFKNNLKTILGIFYFFPLCIMFVIKFIMYICFFNLNIVDHLVYPILISFIFVSIIFWRVNRWCFKEYLTDSLSLYAIFKGK